MLITIKAQLFKPQLLLDNRPGFVSFLKHAFQEYDPKMYQRYYDNRRNQLKGFCFGIRLSNPQFNTENISLSDCNIMWNIGTTDLAEGIEIYNAITKQRNKPYPFPCGNSLTVSDVSIRNHKPITSDTICIKMLSPLLVRKHDDETTKDFYYLAPTDSEFQHYFKQSVATEVSILSPTLPSDIEIIPITPTVTTVHTFGHSCTACLGTYVLKSKPELLNMLYQSGIGARRSQGHGMFEVIHI